MDQYLNISPIIFSVGAVIHIKSIFHIDFPPLGPFQFSKPPRRLLWLKIGSCLMMAYSLASGGSIVGVKFLDPLAGLVVSGMILKAGLETGYARYWLFVFLVFFYFLIITVCWLLL